MAEGLPPWLSVTPRDFVLAQQAGAQLGHAIADSTQRAWEARARMQMESEQHQQRAQQQAIENAMNQMAAQRLEQYRRDEVAARSRALDLEQAGLGMRGEGLDIQRERVADMAKFNEMKADATQRRMDDLKEQRDFMNEYRKDESARKKEEAERAMDLREKNLARLSELKPGSITLDASGKLKSVTGAPDSDAVKYVQGIKQKEDYDKAVAAATPSMGGNVMRSIFGWPKLPPMPSTNAPAKFAPDFVPQQTQAAPPPTPAPEIRRRTKDGRVAVFDSDTKKFLRYEDQ